VKSPTRSILKQMAPGSSPEKDPPMIHFQRAEELETWLEEHGATEDELWIEQYKKHTGVLSLTWAEIVEVALCFGWIDSQSRRIDDDRHRQRLTPRRPRSKWSKVNRQKVEALIAAGRMRESGLAEVERAKADGRWDAAYDSPATATVPDDLAAALKQAKLESAFAALDAQNRYAILHRIQTLKRADARARNIEKFCAMLERGDKLHP
jgi:uncharacterized protein YdeI (YjbR/CyaY-like superfamily)